MYISLTQFIAFKVLQITLENMIYQNQMVAQKLSILFIFIYMFISYVGGNVNQDAKTTLSLIRCWIQV